MMWYLRFTTENVWNNKCTHTAEEINHHRSADGPGARISSHSPPDPKTPFLNLGFLLITFSFTLYNIWCLLTPQYAVLFSQSLKHCINWSILSPCNLHFPLHTVFVEIHLLIHCCLIILLLCYIIVWKYHMDHSLAGCWGRFPEVSVMVLCVCFRNRFSYVSPCLHLFAFPFYSGFSSCFRKNNFLALWGSW